MNILLAIVLYIELKQIYNRLNYKQHTYHNFEFKTSIICDKFFNHNKDFGKISEHSDCLEIRHNYHIKRCHSKF